MGGPFALDAAGWTMITVSAIGAVGSIVLQALHMYLSYKRDALIKDDMKTVVKASNGITERMITAELTAQKVVSKAEIAANTLLVTAATTAIKLESEKRK